MVAELDDKMLSLNDAIQACLLSESGGFPSESGKERLDDITENVIGGKRFLEGTSREHDAGH